MPEFPPQDPNFQQRVRDSYNRQAFMALLGAKLARVEPGEVDLELAPRPDLVQQHGFLHAGVVASAVDSACGYAAFSLMTPDAAVLTAEFKINLLAPAEGVRFVARGRVLKPGRTLFVCRGEAIAVQADGSEKLIAAMQATIMAIRGRPGVEH
jgi:uncharacterized protein (TIGR00369 family)